MLPLFAQLSPPGLDSGSDGTWKALALVLMVLVVFLALFVFVQSIRYSTAMEVVSRISTAPPAERGGGDGFALLLFFFLVLGALIYLGASRLAGDGTVVVPGPPASPGEILQLPGMIHYAPVADDRWRPAAVVAPDGAWLRESADGAGRIVLAQGAVIEVDVDSRSEVDGILWYRVRRRGPGGGWEAGWMAFRAPDGSQLIDYVDRR